MGPQARFITGLISFLLLLPSLVWANDIKILKQEAVATTQTFVKQLGSAMQKEMKAGGPMAAAKVCSELAPQITSQISRDKGWKVTRVGARVRNPMLGIADRGEQEVLKKFQERKSKGESFEKMAYAEIVDEPNGKYFRFMKAIGVKGQCLACHGGSTAIKQEVKDMLAKNYPHDKAKGYKVGDLRGAVSIKRPL